MNRLYVFVLLEANSSCKLSCLKCTSTVRSLFMDRKLEKKNLTTQKVLIAVVAGIAVLYVVYAAFTAGSGQSLNVDGSRLQIVTVTEGTFQEDITVNGTIVPQRSIYLDAVEGGRVERILAEAGESVREGDTLLVLSNNNLQLDVMNREAQILEQINTSRNTRLQLLQRRLSIRNDLLTHQSDLEGRKRAYDRDLALFNRGLVSEDVYIESRRLFNEAKDRLKLYEEQVALDSVDIENQLSHIDASVLNMERNLALVGRMADFLIVRAPISGQLTSLDAEIGESKSAGQRLGQIDVTDTYKVRAEVDEVYISRVVVGQNATFEFDNRSWELSVSRVYPEVRNGRFEVDLDFSGDAPAAIRRGQSVRVRLALSEFSSAILLDRGAFFQTTGGQWVFVVNESGDSAEKRDIRVTRQNTRFYAIDSGLQSGDRVIISGYADFGNATELVIK
jgi:HlyD family secretion protein